MARLYVVNATGQHRVVNYRTEFTVDDEGRRTTERNRPYKHIEVKARSQIQFGGDLNIKQVHTLIAQLEKTCSAVPMKDISTAKARGVVRMIWNVDAPVPLTVLKDVIQHNIEILMAEGEDRRRRFAMGANFHMGNLSDPTTDTVRDTSVEFESVDTTEDNDLVSPTLKEGLRISKAPRPRGGGARKKAA